MSNQTLQGIKYRWQLPNLDTKLVLDVASSYNLSLPIAQTLVNRGLATKEDLESYLFSSFAKDVASPTLMKDAQKAADRIMTQ